MALINYLTKILFDFGALALLPEDMSILARARPLVVTDKNPDIEPELCEVTHNLAPRGKPGFGGTTRDLSG